MKHVSEEELGGMTQSGKYEWKGVYDPGGSPDLPELRDGSFMLQCLRCKAHFTLEECPNCGKSEFFFPNESLTCLACRKGFSSWKCENCATVNPVANTLFLLRQKPKGCFVATACYGAPDAPEVIRLRDFRDRVLSRSRFGRWLIGSYYTVAPPIADWTSRSSRRRTLMRALFIAPVLTVLTRLDARKH